ncbi:MAG: hypothetical protein JZU65_22280 [Chlorobium sp.]|jgi:hypothetical protein|nr:hypothetical protein [Chlorobium sp.]
MNIETQIAKAFHECKSKAIKKQCICFHPGCDKKSINSHILQKNGILSAIAEDNHVVEMNFNKFTAVEHGFKRVGINKAFSFNCFCVDHDTELFRSIEVEEIDFSDYKNLILFTLRTIYNEKFHKLVNIDMYNCLLKSHSDIMDNIVIEGMLKNEMLGLKDIEVTENQIWVDIKTGSQSFIFNIRDISRKDICLSAFYNYETTEELETYLEIHGRAKEKVTDIFVNLFPYKDRSIFMMSYKKENEKLVKGYINAFFSDNEKRLERKITNLMMFQCETWAVSNKFYINNIAKTEDAFAFAVEFSLKNMNERKFFDLNIFRADFPAKYNEFRRRHMNT